MMIGVPKDKHGTKVARFSEMTKFFSRNVNLAPLTKPSKEPKTMLLRFANFRFAHPRKTLAQLCGKFGENLRFSFGRVAKKT